MGMQTDLWRKMAHEASSSSGVSWEQLGDKDRLFLVCKFEELMGHMQKEMHYNVSNEKDRAVVDTLAARAIASEPVLAVLEKSKKAGFDGVQVSCKIADSDGRENGAKPRRDGSPRRRNRSRSLSSARAGAEMMKVPPRQAAPLAERQEPLSSSAAVGSDAASQAARRTPAVVHGGSSSGKEESRGEGAHSVGGKKKIKRTASGNLLLKIAAGSATVGLVRVVVAVVAAVLQGRAQGREGPEAMVRGDQGRSVGTEGDSYNGKAGKSLPQRPGKARDGLEQSAS